MPDDGVRLRDVGEGGLLRRLFPLLPTGGSTLLGPGDDAAVLAAPDGRVVVTTDTMLEGQDFRRDWSDPQDVGVKAAAQNLADVAAMGAVPTGLVVSLVAPGDLPVAWATGFARGLATGCAGTGAGVVGGDLTAGPLVVVTITALGDLQGWAPVRRDGARPGDRVAHAGVLGWSDAGWEVLRQCGPQHPGGVLDAAVAAHRRPDPPLAAGPAAARAGATAMLDVSDGLLRDAGRVAAASGVVLDLDRRALQGAVDALAPVAAALDRTDRAEGPADPWRWVLGGGEDHGLLATFPPGVVVPAPFRVIGTVCPAPAGQGGDRAGEGARAGGVLLDGDPVGVPGGWDHFGG